MSTKSDKLGTIFEREVIEMLNFPSLREAMEEEIRNILRMMIAKEMFGLDIKVVQNANSGKVLQYIFTPQEPAFRFAPFGDKLLALIRERVPIMAPKIAIEIVEELEMSEQVRNSAREYAQTTLDESVLGEVRSVMWNKAREAAKSFAEKTVERVLTERKLS